jgi:hypothetical protein
MEGVVPTSESYDLTFWTVLSFSHFFAISLEGGPSS